MSATILLKDYPTFPVVECEECGDRYPSNILNKGRCYSCLLNQSLPTSVDRAACAADDKRKMSVED